MTTLFERELKKGTGIPLILLKNNIIFANDQISEIIINAILQTNYYDAQSEGVRGDYLYENLMNEFQYDCNEETRKIANEYNW